METFTRQLELCRVGADDAIVVLLDSQSDPSIVDAGRLAAERVGSHPVLLTVPALRNTDELNLLDNAVALAALSAATLIIDLTSSGIGREPELAGLLDDGARAFSAGHVTHSDLEWFVPHVGLAPRADATMDAIASSSSLTLATHAEHELAISLSEYKVAGDTAVVDTDGDYAIWPSGALRLTPGEETVNGSAVLMPGDINATAGAFVRSPVVLVVESDRVCDILGTGADADLIRAQFESLANADAYGIAAVVVGLNRPATSGAGFDPALLARSRSLLSGGHVTLRFGNNDLAGRPVDGSLEFTLRNASLLAGTRELIEAGALQDELAPDIYERAAYG